MKQTWQAINDIIGKGRKQSSQCKFKDESNNIITNSHDISDKFNDFFVNVGPKLASSIQNTGKNYFDYLHDMKSNKYVHETHCRIRDYEDS